ncbi:MAG: choice-of-anchor B family protein [Calditrichaeota bacterium]|nr:MAG: choice-of-anchor B family protein [Calditrichota bacterium]
MKHLNKIWVVVVLLTLPIMAQQSYVLPLLANFNPYPSIGYNDCWGYTAPDGREYALLGVESGTSIVDITDTDNLVEIAFIPSANSTWKDIKTYQHYAYVVTDLIGLGLQIIDLSTLPDSVTLVNTYTGFSISHNIYIDESNALLYAEGGGGIRILTLADPVNPVQIAFFGVPSHDVYAAGNIAYVSQGWSGTYGLYNVSNPFSPTLITQIITPSGGYAHNAWASEDGDYLMTTEEVPAGLTVKLWDISDVNNITLTDDYIASSGGRPHNTHIKGNYAYISHYWDGLRIVDISNPDSIFEVSYYDTYPNPGSQYEGDWGAYPFYHSGKVIASDRTYGLFVLYFPPAGEQGISLTATTLEFDTVAVGSSVLRSFEVVNSGAVILNVADIQSTNPAFSPGITSFSLHPGESQTVEVSFTPLSEGNYEGELYIFSSDPVADSLTVLLSGVATTPTDITQAPGVPSTFSVSPNYPNPFNPVTTISYQIPQTSPVKLAVYDMNGKLVKVLVDQQQAAGNYQVQWDGVNQQGQPVVSGVYFYTFRAGQYTQTRKMVLLK